jgi:16S rRNA (cytosine1402-N4)-methyltransferase
MICSCKHTKSIKILTKKPIIPGEQEVKNNPRSRSAKARYAIKL